MRLSWIEFTRQVKCCDIQAAKGSPLGQIFADGPQSEIASDQIYIQSRKDDMMNIPTTTIETKLEFRLSKKKWMKRSHRPSLIVFIPGQSNKKETGSLLQF